MHIELSAFYFSKVFVFSVAPTTLRPKCEDQRKPIKQIEKRRVNFIRVNFIFEWKIAVSRFET
jgi:hypothetical protein